MKTRIAIITDLHYTREKNASIRKHQGEFADVLLLRAVHRLNRWVKPHVTVLSGDLIDDPAAADAEELLLELKKSIDLLECRSFVLPGNHDPDPERFYRIFMRPAAITEVNGVRLIAFPDDRKEPGHNACRSREQTSLFQQARYAFNGSIVSLQHVPLFPPGELDCPYNYSNAEEIIDAMRDNGVTLSLSGHYHPGFPAKQYGDTTFLAAPAACEAPFRFLVIDIDSGTATVDVTEHALAMQRGLKLTDYHVHTRLAYCNENMDTEKALELGDILGLDGITFTEHSAHLYFSRKDYDNRFYFKEGIDSAAVTDLTDVYFAMLHDRAIRHYRVGMEIDVDKQGRLVIRREAWRLLDFHIGALHSLTKDQSYERINDEFLALTKCIVSAGVKVLAHPFRIFRRSGFGDPPQKLFAPVVKLLKEYRVAAEINFHTDEPPQEFVRQCLAAGVKITLGSDSHNLYEVGEFFPHLELLKSVGCTIPDHTVVLNN